MDKRIIFMGTPEFAVASLAALIDNGYNVVAVITSPDKPAGRGLQLTQSAVKKYAIEKGLEILQPLKLKDPDFLKELENLNADIQVVVAFRMLPELVWDMPPLGTVNVHGSLLPQYRGAAPINWAIINGETETGVTTFKLKHQIDTGNILLQQTIRIEPNENAGELHDKMMKIGADLLVKTLRGLFNNELKEVPQLVIDETQIKHAPKIFSETCEISWNKRTDEIVNFIRGLSPYPGAYTKLNGKKLKIYSALKSNLSNKIVEENNGICTDGKTFLRFKTFDGFVDVIDIQPEGKKRMNIADFLRGNKINTK